MTENEISKVIYNSGLKVHKELGPGLLEKAYEKCLIHELLKAGLFVEAQKPMPLHYDGLHLDVGYRLDLMVENKVIIEVKAVEELSNLHFSQLLTYLTLTDASLAY